MKEFAICLQQAKISSDIFSIFSKRDNILMFCTGKRRTEDPLK